MYFHCRFLKLSFLIIALGPLINIDLIYFGVVLLSSGLVHRLSYGSSCRGVVLGGQAVFVLSCLLQDLTERSFPILVLGLDS